VNTSTTRISWTEHDAYQRNKQAHVLPAMNAEARVAKRCHARFRPLAYAARSMPRGSIGSPPERGAGVYADRSGTHQTRSGHVSASDPRLGPVQGPSMFCPGTLGPIVGDPDPKREGVRLPFQGSGLHTWRSWTNLGGRDCISRGPTLSHRGPVLLLMPWSISPFLDTWRLRTRPCGGVRRCCGPRVVARG
jgi:hypothetical protein